MTAPTKAIAPLMLEDYHRVLAERPGSGPTFERQHIAASLARATGVQLQQTVQVAEGFEVTAYYAGHVLGAAAFHIRVGHQTLVYTGGLCVRRAGGGGGGAAVELLALPPASWLSCWRALPVLAPSPARPPHPHPRLRPACRRLQLDAGPPPGRRRRAPPAPAPAHQ
jgi:hypothetical protein